MNVLSRLAGKLHNAISRHRTRRTPTVVARHRMPLNGMPRLGEVDGDTAWIPRAGSPGVNTGSGYRAGRHRAPDLNRVPDSFARQRVA